MLGALDHDDGDGKWKYYNNELVHSQHSSHASQSLVICQTYSQFQDLTRSATA